MVSEQKVRMMIRLAEYESHEGKQDFARTKYYKMDYIRLQILKTLVCVTCAVVLIAVIAGLYNMEYLITNALELDYISIGRTYLVIYILLLGLFSFVTVSVSSLQYEASKKRVKEYYLVLQELIRYYEKEEDVYMQQITKLLVNVGGIPGNWNTPAGLPCEIVPLAKPYGLWTGNVFQGQVLSNGKPVAGAEVEVEYMSHEPNLKKNGLSAKSSVKYPNGVMVTQAIMTDANGVFTFGIPKAGWWGFAALGVGPDKKHDGKELSQDAVIWVQAVDMK